MAPRKSLESDLQETKSIGTAFTYKFCYRAKKVCFLSRVYAENGA